MCSLFVKQNMASSKTFLLGLAFVVVILIIFSEVSARELAETHAQTNQKEALPGGKVFYEHAGPGGNNSFERGRNNPEGKTPGNGGHYNRNPGAFTGRSGSANCGRAGKYVRGCISGPGKSPGPGVGGPARDPKKCDPNNTYCRGPGTSETEPKN